jgi:hypothetical protein
VRGLACKNHREFGGEYQMILRVSGTSKLWKDGRWHPHAGVFDHGELMRVGWIDVIQPVEE